MTGNVLLLVWTLIFVFLMMNGFVALFEKWSIEKKVVQFANRHPNKFTEFFFKMVQCEFCIEHHMGVLAIVIWCLIAWDFHLVHLCFPMMSAGLSITLKRR